MVAGQNITVPGNLEKNLAVAVRSIQWSYAIFWSLSATQTGMLEWGDGYYNGDIKTRKTIQTADIREDQLGLTRSEQLRELYVSLSAGEPSADSHISRRSSAAALSPEDLTDTEWYYLVCMSFVFNIGEGLTGRTMAKLQPIWLCNAQNADSNVFTRSLLAKSASVQTVVCFPFIGGIVEVGTTEHIKEDLNIIQCVKTSFLEASGYSTAPTRPGDDRYVTLLGSETNDEFEQEHDSIMGEGINDGVSQMQSWQLVDEDLSNCIHPSQNSSECVSHTVVELGTVPCGARIKTRAQETQPCGQLIGEHNRVKIASFDAKKNSELNYQNVLSTILKTTHQLILGPQFENLDRSSSFTRWKRGSLGNVRGQKGNKCVSQRMVKNIIFEVPRMYKNDVFLEKKRQEKLNERFIILRSMVPSIKKVDKVTILDDTIEYLQGLKRKIRELESCREYSTGLENGVTKRKRFNGAGERTSAEPGTGYVALTDNLRIGSFGKEVVIELRCAWREGILLEIMDIISDLNLDSHSVQSSTTGGFLFLTVKCKHKGSKTATSGMIKEAIQSVAWIYAD